MGMRIAPRKRLAAGQSPTVTLADVARLADVSEITVSRILRDVGPIAKATRARVLAAVEQTGYVPNRVAGTLASATSNLIGVVIPSLSNIVFAEVLRGIDAGLEPSGFRPVIGITGYDALVEEKLVGSLLAWKPAAMIIVGFEHTEVTRRRLMQSGVRVAELMDIDSEPIDLAVGLSHRAAGYDGARHLIARGYRRFGYVGHDWETDRRAHLRYEGMTAALAEAGLSIVGQAMVEGASSTQAGRMMLASLLKRTPDLDAVVFSNDDMAVGGGVPLHRAWHRAQARPRPVRLQRARHRPGPADAALDDPLQPLPDRQDRRGAHSLAARRHGRTPDDRYRVRDRGRRNGLNAVCGAAG